jgi:hypothetical protein
LVVVFGGAMGAGHRFGRSVVRTKRSRAVFIGPPFALLLSLWAANSGLTIAGRLGSSVVAVAEVLGQGLLGMVPLAGNVLSGLVGNLFSQANNAGLSVIWGVDASGVLLGGLLLGCAGAWVGARLVDVIPVPAAHRGSSSPPGTLLVAVPPGCTGSSPPVDALGDQKGLGAPPLLRGDAIPAPSSGVPRPQVPEAELPLVVCASCASVEDGGASQCQTCGALL